MAQIKGIDISEWQGNPDFAALKANLDFVIIRASFGTARADRDFISDRDSARSVGLDRGFYHYAYPQYNNPVSEADFFVNEIGALANGEVLALDFEEAYGDPVNWCLAWLNRVHDRTGVKPLLYVNFALVQAHDWSPVVNSDYGLWLADWGASSPPATPWPFVALWQYSDNTDVPGVGKVDADVFFGDLVTFEKYGAQGNAPTPPLPQPAQPGENPIDATVNVAVDSLNARTAPNTASPVVASFTSGSAHANAWVDGELVTVNGRTDNVWLKSDAGHWFAQAGTDGDFGHTPPPPPAPVITPPATPALPVTPAPTPPAPDPTPATPPPAVTPPAPPADNNGGTTVGEVTPPAVQPVVTIKPGWKTTEFWLNLAVQAGALLTLGQQVTSTTGGTVWVKVIAVLGAVLSSLGYTHARAAVKVAAAAVATNI